VINAFTGRTLSIAGCDFVSNTGMLRGEKKRKKRRGRMKEGQRGRER
jgi:hypothetical protein